MTDTITRGRLTEWASNLKESSLSEVRESIQSLESTVSDYHEAMGGYYLELRQHQRRLDALLAMSGNENQAIEQWELIVSHPRIVDQQFDGRKFILLTDDMTMRNPEREGERWLGQFMFEIHVDGSSQIRITNLHTRRGGRNHPHITGDGRPCFGGSNDEFYRLLADGEIYALVDVLIGYVELLNPRDEYGRYGSWWMDVSDERANAHHIYESLSERGEPTWTINSDGSSLTFTQREEPF